jgi:hypothetical protein
MKQYNGKNGTVNAGKIVEVTQNEGNVVLDDGGRHSHSTEWHRQNKPQPGNYYVLTGTGEAKVMSADEFQKDFEVQQDTTLETTSTSERRAKRDEAAQKAGERPKTREQTMIEEREKQRERDQEEAANRAAEQKKREFRAGGLIQNVQARENAQRQQDNVPKSPDEIIKEEKEHAKQD